MARPRRIAFFAKAITLSVCAGCVYFLWLMLSNPNGNALKTDDWTLLGLTALPFIGAVAMISPLARLATRDFYFRLVIRKADTQDWQRVNTAVKAAWRYEGERFAHSLKKMQVNAWTFGALATLGLAGSLSVRRWSWRNIHPHLGELALSFVVAVAVGYVLNLVRLLVRIAGQDFNARMFAWATRSLVYIMIADLLLMLVGGGTGSAPGTTPESWRLTLSCGLVSALLGERAVELLLDKAQTLVGLKSPEPQKASALLALDGITQDDIERFAEENVRSLQDLAFAPTARLFFNTNHSLQRLCDWQDQAILLVYLGAVRAKAITDQLGIRGAIDLQWIAQCVLAPKTPPIVVPPAPPPAPIITGGGSNGPDADSASTNLLAGPLSKALGMEGEALTYLLETIETDEVIMRPRVHWVSTPGSRAKAFANITSVDVGRTVSR